MSHGLIQVQTVTMTSGASVTSVFDLGRCFQKVFLSTAGSTNGITFSASDSLSGTYRTVYHDTINSATVGQNVYTVASGVAGIFPIPNGLRYMKILADGGIADGETFKIICSDQGTSG